MKKKNACNNKSCVQSSGSASTKLAKTLRTNGKGDKPRPFSKEQYDKNYESINWKSK